MNCFPIESLPNELIGQVFKSLSKSDRISLSLVNKRFCNIYKREAGFKFNLNIVLDPDLVYYESDEAWIDLTVDDSLEQRLHVAVYVRLTGLDCQ